MSVQYSGGGSCREGSGYRYAAHILKQGVTGKLAKGLSYQTHSTERKRRITEAVY